MTITATPEAEGAQALFCYIADVLGAKTANKEFDTYLDKKSKKFVLKRNNPLDKR